MKVVILCGGKGTRLREYTEDIPKALVEVGGKPILWHVMRSFAHHGYKDFILCLGYKGNLIRRYFLDINNRLHGNFTLQLGEEGSTIVPDKGAAKDHWNITFVD